MKILKRALEPNGSGEITVLCEEQEDLWHLYNLIQKGDLVTCKTYRKVVSESSTGSTKSKKTMTVATLRVAESTFESAASGADGAAMHTLRIRGTNMTANPTMKIGQYHTFTLEEKSKLTLRKEEWDAMHLERLENASDVATKAEIAAVLLDEGVANICLVSGSMTVIRANITQAIPKKRRGSTAQHDKALVRFYEAVLQAVLHHINFDIVRCCIVGSPGFLKDEFYEYMFKQAHNRGIKTLFENKSKFLRCHSTSAHKHALEEILSDKSLAGAVVDTQASEQVACLSRFFKMLNDAPERAFYGYGHVVKALEAGAVKLLMVTDNLFRSIKLEDRRKYVKLVEDAKAAGAKVQIFSTQHSSGEELAKICGVAAILKFPVSGIESDDESDTSSDDDDHEGGGGGGGRGRGGVGVGSGGGGGAAR